MQARVAWLLVGLSAACCSSLMGALIVSRHPRHLVGWLLCVVGATASISLVAETYSFWVVEQDGSGPAWAGSVAGWASVILGAPLAIACLTVVFLVVPNGHLLTRRWRFAAFAAVLGLAAFVAGMSSRSPLRFEHDDDGGTGPFATLLLVAGLLMIVGALIASVVSMVRRLRHAQGETRQQLRWIVASAAYIAFGLVFLLAVQLTNGDEQPFLASTPLNLAYFLLPICIAVAVLRHRLYDIDLIINRTLVLALGTAFAAVGYVGLVVVAGSALGSQTGGFWPSLLATALVASAFQPLRRRVARVADRLAYGPRAAPYEALDEFSRRVADTPSTSDLLQAVAEAVGRALGASRVSRADARLAVAGRAEGDVVATWWAGSGQELARTPPSGLPGDATVRETAVIDRGERLGSITVTLPAGGALRPIDARLLADLADQAAVALRSASLEAAVAERVVQLDQQTRDLAASRTRLIEARDRERDRLAATIRQDVLPHLLPLPETLAGLAAAARADSGGRYSALTTRLEQLMDQTNAALESLREITRGVFPAQLRRSGLAAALRAHLSGSVPAGVLEVEPSAQGASFPPRVEAAAYFCYAEAARGLGPPVTVVLAERDGGLALHAVGSTFGRLDVQHLRDRTEPLGGVVDAEVADDRTVLRLTVPCGTAS